MIKLVEAGNDFPYGKYKIGYNAVPSELMPISAELFMDRLTTYCWEYMDSKQMEIPSGRYHAKLFIMADFASEAIGICAGKVWMSGKREYGGEYYSFGDWQEFEHKFALQFKGDNS